MIVLNYQQIIRNIFQIELHYLSISILHSKIYTYGLNKYVPIYIMILIWIIFLHVLKYLFGSYFFPSHMCTLYTYLEDGRVLEYSVILSPSK